jgi:hypothetical protein
MMKAGAGVVVTVLSAWVLEEAHEIVLDVVGAGVLELLLDVVGADVLEVVAGVVVGETQYGQKGPSSATQIHTMATLLGSLSSEL